MRVLTDPAETGAVCLALPEDVQTEVVEVPGRVPGGAHLDDLPAPARAGGARAGRRADPRRARGRSSSPAAASSTPRRPARCARSPTRPGIPVAETQAGRGALPSRAPARARRDRRDRHARGEPARARGRPRDRRRHALERLHDRVEVRLPGSGGALRQRQRRRRWTRPSTPGSRWRPTRGWRSTRCATALAGHRAEPAWERRAADEAARLGRGGASGSTPPRHGPLPSQAEVIGAVNAAAGERDVVVCAAGSMPGDLHKLWRTTRPRRQGLPRRVRLLVHGLRDPGRHGRQARRARPRGVRDGRRRLLADAPRRARRPRSPSGSSSSSCSSRTTATRRSARSRARSAAPATGRTTASRRTAACPSTTGATTTPRAGRPRRQRREPRRARAARAHASTSCAPR